MIEDIRKELFALQDEKYQAFQVKLFPTLNPESIIGVRTPDLRSYAKKLLKQEEIAEFLSDLPHRYFDENQLHAFIISEMKDYERCIGEVKRFLPFVDNWATCDQMSPKVFKKHLPELLECIRDWIGSGKTYTIRFAVGMLLEHYLDDAFDLKYPEIVASIRSSEYYVNMMIAWYFATALAKQYEAILPFIESRKLDTWTHNKAIQKAVESYRVSEENKQHLKTLKTKN